MRRLRIVLAWLLILVGGFLAWRVLFAAKTGPGAGFKNLLLVTLDTTRADHLGCYGFEGASTPVLDGLANEGVLFERCVTSAPYTLPAHASILTGLLPLRHGVRVNGTQGLPAEVQTLAESLSNAGFDTGAVVSALVLDSRFGLNQGFDRYDDDLSAGGEARLLQYRETAGDDTLRRAVRWLKERGNERFFLWTQFFDAHDPYEPPAEFAARFPGRPYDGEIAFADECLGRLLEELRHQDRLDDTLVVVVGDHGESLGDHGETLHGHFVYLATTHVPFIVHHPKLAAGKRVGEFVSVVDVAPTVLDLLDVEGPRDSNGLSHAGALLYAEQSVRVRPVYSEAALAMQHPGWSDLQALRSGHQSFIRAPRPESYDLETDPGELQNLYPGDPAAVQALESRVEEMLATTKGITAAELAEDPGLAAGLAELGYVSPNPAGTSTGAAADPKDVLHLVEWAQAALRCLRAGELAHAEEFLRKILAEDPGDQSIQSLLLGALLKEGRPDEAADLQFRQSPVDLILQSLILRMEYPSMDVHLEPVADLIESVGLPARIQHLLSALLIVDGWKQSVVPKLEQVLAAEPGNLEVRLALLRIQLGLGKWSEAEDLLAEARQQAPLQPDVLLAQAQFQIGRGDAKKAFAFLVEAQRSAPQNPEVLLRMAQWQLAESRPEEADRYVALALAAPPWTPTRDRPEVFSLLMPGLAEASTLQLLQHLAVGKRRLAIWTEVGLALQAAGSKERQSQIAARIESIRSGFWFP